MRFVLFGFLLVSVLATLQIEGLCQTVAAGAPIRYEPFFPAKWRANYQSTKMVPWEGERGVLLTLDDQLEPQTMAVFLRRLDAGWELYDKLIGQKPLPFKTHRNKVTIAAVPSPSFTCGMGCGHLGRTGIEVAGFYRSHHHRGSGDYEGVRNHPKEFAHYYFYEMGRNYYLFGDRHNLFTTGFAVFMRCVCMDTRECIDPDIAAFPTRSWMESDLKTTMETQFIRAIRT